MKTQLRRCAGFNRLWKPRKTLLRKYRRFILPKTDIKRSGGISYFSKKLADGTYGPLIALRVPTEIRFSIEMEPTAETPDPTPAQPDPAQL